MTRWPLKQAFVTSYTLQYASRIVYTYEDLAYLGIKQLELDVRIRGSSDVHFL